MHAFSYTNNALFTNQTSLDGHFRCSWGRLFARSSANDQDDNQPDDVTKNDIEKWELDRCLQSHFAKIIGAQMKWLENIHIEQQHMERLVSDLLTISRADTSEEEIQRTFFSLDSLLKSSVEKFSPVCQNKTIQLKANLASEVPFYGDQQRINQLVMILLDNAYQYSNEGGQITLTLKNLPKDIQISVKDTGIGISEENVTKLFDRFFRVTNSRKKNPDGLGLGLSIAKLITQQHQGDITVTSTVGEGTEFIVTLPKKSESSIE